MLFILLMFTIHISHFYYCYVVLSITFTNLTTTHRIFFGGTPAQLFGRRSWAYIPCLPCVHGPCQAGACQHTQPKGSRRNAAANGRYVMRPTCFRARPIVRAALLVCATLSFATLLFTTPRSPPLGSRRPPGPLVHATCLICATV